MHRYSTSWAGLMAAALLAAPATLAWGQGYPNRPVRLLIGFSAGGGADTVARSVAPRLAEALGQQVVVENRPGANGIIAADLAARASPDGYTLLVAPGNYAFAPAMIAKLPFDMTTAFGPVSMLAVTPLLVVVHPSLPVRDMKGLIALARQQPGKLTYASGGIGGSAHLATELFRSLTATDVVHVPYKGTGAAIADLIGGQVPLCFCTLPSVLGQTKGGRLRALAVTTNKRSAALPEIPTVAEAGVPGYEMGQWYGLLAPAGTPAAIVERLNAEAGRALQHPELRKRFLSEGAESAHGTPAAFGAFFQAEIALWMRVAKQAGIVPQ
jgi:tripartite-type tricarboxylate transporter receptor subunit TctC